MRTLLDKEREFLENLIKYKPQKKDGYFNFKFQGKSYKRSRVLIQLHLNKKLEIWENVHHKDGNKENDCIENLEVLDISEHISYHHKRVKNGNNLKERQYNKLSKEKIGEIFRLAKKYKWRGKPNYSKIAEELNISDFTVSRYVNGELY